MATKRFAQYLRPVRFIIVGLITMAVFYALVFAFVDLLAVTVLYATAFAYVLAVLLNYLLHRGFTYGGATSHGHSLPRYLAVILAGFLLNQLVMYVGVNMLDLHYLAVQFFSMSIIVISNYIALQLWAFAEPKP